jgi:hypothetical protein
MVIDGAATLQGSLQLDARAASNSEDLNLISFPAVGGPMPGIGGSGLPARCSSISERTGAGHGRRRRDDYGDALATHILARARSPRLRADAGEVRLADVLYGPANDSDMPD